MVVDLPFRQHQHQGAVALVADGVQLGVQAALGPPDAPWPPSLTSRLAAVRKVLERYPLIRVGERAAA
jgi:hypothetical protein